MNVKMENAPVTPPQDTTPADVACVEDTEVQTPVILSEVKETDGAGKYIGQTKWFNDKLGYGFVTICNGDDKGKDIFVHHSGIKPLNSNYKTLKKGEYIQFNIINGMNGLQAVDVTGINAGPLMCDFVTTKRSSSPERSQSSPVPMRPSGLTPRTGDWQTVPNRKAKFSREGRAQLKMMKQQRTEKKTA